MRDTTEAQDPEPRSVRVIVANLERETAFSFTTPKGERVCIVDRRVLNNRPKARESAFKVFSGLFVA